MKSVVIRMAEALVGLANQSIIAYAIKKNIKPENFSEYIRRLVKEDWERTKLELRPKLNTNSSEVL